MHESHHDTWNYSNRKPRTLRNTPANKFSHLLSGGVVVTFALLCHLYT